MKNKFNLSKVMSIIVCILIIVVIFQPPMLAKEKVTIAYVGPMTGSVANMGLGARNSVILAVNQYNRGEFGEKKYEYAVKSFDDECSPTAAVRVAEKAVSDVSVMGVVSHYCSIAGMATKPIYTRSKVGSIVWGAVAPSITIPSSKYINRICGTLREQNDATAKWAREFAPAFYGVDLNTFVLICDSSEYGRMNKEYFSKSIKKYGGEILAVYDVAVGQLDFSTELTKAKALNPDVIFYGMIMPEAARARGQQYKLNIDSLMLSCSGAYIQSFCDSIGKEALEGCIAFSEAAPPEMYAGGSAFDVAYKKENFKQLHESYGIYAYSAARVIMDIVEKIGPDSSEKVADEIANLDIEDSPIGPVKMDENGQNIKVPYYSYVGQDGNWVIWENSEYATKGRIPVGIKRLLNK